MTWDNASLLARGGVPVRRTAWKTAPTLSGGVIYFSSGAGTTRAVAVFRLAGVESIVTPTTFGAAEFLADDWEVA